jgi:16S rRNA (cytidine1402-2'-O)-methyltransferase
MIAASAKGLLYLVPTPLDFGCDLPAQPPLSDVLPEQTLRIAACTSHWISENAKSTRAFLKRVATTHPLVQPLQAMHISELPRVLHKKGDFGAEPISDQALQPLLTPALNGHPVGLVSEAGMPAIADPGARVVRLAHKLGIRVVPLVGPSSLLLALAASGMNGQRFAFVGYLPQNTTERQHAIGQLEARAHKLCETQVFIETPFRNQALLDGLLQTIKPHTVLAVSSGLTLEGTSASTGLQSFSAPASVWRQQPHRLNLTLPAVFAIAP